MTIHEIYKALDEGKEVNWCHDGYYVHKVKYDRGINKYSLLSWNEGEALRVTCKSNYFGSLIDEKDLSRCFIVVK